MIFKFVFDKLPSRGYDDHLPIVSINTILLKFRVILSAICIKNFYEFQGNCQKNWILAKSDFGQKIELKKSCLLNDWQTTIITSAMRELFEDEFYGWEIDCKLEVLGALLTFSLPYIKVNWQHHGTVVFVISSVCLGVSLVLMGTIHNLFLAYVLYIVVDMVYRLSNTIAR